MDETEKTDTDLLAEAVARVKAAAAATTDTYVTVGSADLARIIASPRLAGSDLAKALFGPVAAQLRTAEAAGEDPKPTHLHRQKHLAPLLAGVGGA